MLLPSEKPVAAKGWLPLPVVEKQTGFIAGLVKCLLFLVGLSLTVFSLRKVFLEGGGGAARVSRYVG